MNIKIGEYQITSDSMQFIVNKIGIVQESRLTKAENVGKETSRVIAYCGKFDEALRFIPNDVLKSNDDINIIIDKLSEIKADIKQIKEYPVIESKDGVNISKEEYESLLESDRKLDALECAGVDNWGGYGDAMDILRRESEEE
ncbi:MAG: hypothetical protein LLF98_11655 [Clostridium sp.]|uniref:hypothetical protein n=1 Tax=Clostridium sp. TaxID=1506 RepID=UPI0025C5CA91|nr:hypothetical protein [Clostridium sp.]MCE5221884.1 hypothetical protein [Clostridium sp.]